MLAGCDANACQALRSEQMPLGPGTPLLHGVRRPKTWKHERAAPTDALNLQTSLLCCHELSTSHLEVAMDDPTLVQIVECEIDLRRVLLCPAAPRRVDAQRHGSDQTGKW
eukprot:3691650-Pleurochrysis_carterae.AAC.1